MVLALVHGLGRGGGRREADEQPALLLLRLVDRQRVERGRAEDVTGADLELRPVARADDDGAVELSVGERALLVRARVLERDPAVGGTADADEASLHVDLAQRPQGGVADGPEVVPGGVAHAPIIPDSRWCIQTFGST